MDLLHDAPPGFDAIARAFAMAKLLPGTHQAGARIGLLCEGVLFALGRLDGFRQVNFFAEHVRELGWQEHLLGDGADMQGCDMLFSQSLEAEDLDDPSLIRRTAVDLWT